MARRWSHAAAPLYLCLCLILGGSAQGIFANMILQLLGLGLLAWAAMMPRPDVPSGAERQLYALILLSLALVAIQLVPLPPSIWPHLGGRGVLAEGYQVLGVAIPWLPISVAPYDSLATLLTVIPPLALLALVLRVGARPLWLIAALLGGLLAGILFGNPAGEQSDRDFVALVSLCRDQRRDRDRFLRQRQSHGDVAGDFNSVPRRLARDGAKPARGAPALFGGHRPRYRGGCRGRRRSRSQRLACGLRPRGAGDRSEHPAVAPGAIAGKAVGWDRCTRVARRNAGRADADAARRQRHSKRGEDFGRTRRTRYSRPRCRRRGRSCRSAPASAPFPGFIRCTKTTTVSTPEPPSTTPTTTMSSSRWRPDCREWRCCACSCCGGRPRRCAPGPPLDSGPFARAAVIASAAILVHSLVDFPLRTAAIASCFAMCLALLVRWRPAVTAVVAEPAELRPTRHVVIH